MSKEPPGHTDLMVCPESLDAWLEANPLPEEPMIPKPAPLEYPYVYYWNRMDRKGQFCAVLARGKMNSILVKFEDGFTAITSRNAVRKRKP